MQASDLFIDAHWLEGTPGGEQYYPKVALSASMLKIVDNPELFIDRWRQLKTGIADPRDTESPAMRSGTMLDDLVFNPAARYAPRPRGAQGLTDCEGATYIAPKAYADVMHTLGALRGSIWWDLLKGETNYHQLEVHAIHVGTGYEVKCRTDSVCWWDTKCWVGQQKPIVDLKKTTGNALKKWRYQCEDRGHYVQAAMNLSMVQAAGLECKSFLHVAVAEDYPNPVRAFKLLQSELPPSDYIESLPPDAVDWEYQCHDAYPSALEDLDFRIHAAVDLIENGPPRSKHYVMPVPPRRYN